ncbi:MAG: hypothetical protein O6829_06140 [Alphaproteobacteria bacterium]|nr:hypothetical protein [Alphaproteobacteria bacterium]
MSIYVHAANKISEVLGKSLLEADYNADISEEHAAQVMAIMCNAMTHMKRDDQLFAHIRDARDEYTAYVRELHEHKIKSIDQLFGEFLDAEEHILREAGLHTLFREFIRKLVEELKADILDATFNPGRIDPEKARDMVSQIQGMVCASARARASVQSPNNFWTRFRPARDRLAGAVTVIADVTAIALQPSLFDAGLFSSIAGGVIMSLYPKD